MTHNEMNKVELWLANELMVNGRTYEHTCVKNFLKDKEISLCPKAESKAISVLTYLGFTYKVVNKEQVWYKFKLED